MEFTEEQKAIFDFVAHGSGHGIIDAVAGAGKTTTIMECARYIPEDATALFCAFNNSIASEIRKKFQKRGMSHIVVKTMHALGLQILNENSHIGEKAKLQNNKYETLLRSPDLEEKFNPFIAQMSGERGGSFDHLFRRRLLNINQKFRLTLCGESFEEFREMVLKFRIFRGRAPEQLLSPEEKEQARINLMAFQECNRILLNAGNLLAQEKLIIDYTDMLYLPHLWRQQPFNKFHFLFVDECQDLSRSQFAIAAKYAKSNGRILAVGDPYQSIYGFTGADTESFERVQRYTQATPLTLTHSFRCPKKVIELAQKIRSDITGVKEEEGVVLEIDYDEFYKQLKPEDMVLSRFRMPLIRVLLKLINQEIKVFVNHAEVLEIVNELKSLFTEEEWQTPITSYPNQFITLRGKVIARRGEMIEKEYEWVTDPAVRYAIIKREVEHLRDVMLSLTNSYLRWQEFCQTPFEIVAQLKERMTDRKGAVVLSTIHRAKGLENRRVFLLEANRLPHMPSGAQKWEYIQEKNLLYVALTRSLQELYLINFDGVLEQEIEHSLYDLLPEFLI